MLCNIPFQILFMTFGKRRNTLIHLFFCTLLCRLPQTLAKNSTVKFPSNEAGNKKNGSEVTTSSSTTVNTTLSAHDKVSAEREDLKMQIESLKEKNKDLLDKYKRALADTENTRRRFRKQLEESMLYGIQSFCKDLLDIADSLSLAIVNVPKEAVNDSNPHLKSLYEGLILTESNLQKVFKNHDLKPINPLGEKFDPNFHEAMFEEKVEGKEPNIVTIVTKIGYKLNDRVIRPALVGISKA